jgi:hypothetical protein
VIYTYSKLRILLAISIVILAGVVSAAAFLHYTCVQGRKVGAEVLWTPILLLNSPYLGYANATSVAISSQGAPIDLQAGQLNLINGAAAGLFSLVNWSIYEQHTVLSLGLPGNQGCNSYVAVYDTSSFLSGPHTFGLLPAGTTSDVNEARSVQFDHIPSVFFNNSFYFGVPGEFGISTCYGGVGGIYNHPTANSIQVELQFRNSTITSHVSIVGVYCYYLPSGGTWNVDGPIIGSAGQSPIQPSSGDMAFNFSNC